MGSIPSPGTTSIVSILGLSKTESVFDEQLTLVYLLVVLVMFFLGGCAAGPNPDLNTTDNANHLAGFWSLWQGIISPITFIISLFSHNVNIYEVHNNGGWYNFGFLFGMSLIFGGPARAAASRR